MNKLTIILYITWAWAWTSFYIARAFETSLRILLSMPNSWLAIPASLCSSVENTKKEKINVLSAHGPRGDMTNKFKLFLKYYWEHANEESAFDSNGFSMNKARVILNCSLLYCSYVVSNSTIPVDAFMKNVRRIMFDNDNQTVNGEQVVLAHANFGETINNLADLDLADLDLSD